MKYQLDNIDGMTADNIKDAVKKGDKFLIFKYHISLFAVSLHRLSPAILISNENQKKQFQKKYNLKNILFAPWFFPKGPYLAYSAIKYNNSGGFDATRDILQNIDLFDPQSKSVEIKKVYTVFDQLPNSDIKELRLALKQFFAKHKDINELYVARFINVEEHIEPPYFIGIDTNADIDLLSKEIKNHIYKRFNSFVQFTIFTKDQESDLFDKIQKQGQLITKSGI